MQSITTFPTLANQDWNFFHAPQSTLGLKQEFVTKYCPSFQFTSSCGVPVSCQALLAPSPTRRFNQWGKERQVMEFQAVPLCEAAQQWSVEQGRLFAVPPPLSQLAGHSSCRSRSLASLSSHSQQTLSFLSPHTPPTCLTPHEYNPQTTLNNQ